MKFKVFILTKAYPLKHHTKTLIGTNLFWFIIRLQPKCTTAKIADKLHSAAIQGSQKHGLFLKGGIAPQ